MSGGDKYYHRDVTDSRFLTSRGYSSVAEERLARSQVNPAVLPKNRRIASTCKNPVFLNYDGTGSVGDWPGVFWDKAPMIAGQLVIQGYLEDPMISLGLTGDINGDQAPIQVGDFSTIRALDEWLEKLWRGGCSGGGQGKESYEYSAYFYARRYEMKHAQIPMCIFAGDEGFYEHLTAAELSMHFGGEHESVDARTIFEELKRKFVGNVFMIHPTFINYYGQERDRLFIAQWQEVLGKERVILSGHKRAIGDVILGIMALVGGTRTLDEYINDIRSRPLEMGGITYRPQSAERIAEVRRSLEPLSSVYSVRRASKPDPQSRIQWDFHTIKGSDSN